MSTSLSRRRLLQAAAAMGSLPILESTHAFGQSTPFPKRIIFFYTPNGNLFLPETMSFAGSQLDALSPFASKMVLIRGLDLLAVLDGPGEPHQQGMALLTGRRLNAGNQRGGDGTLAGWASGISVDQAIAKAIGQSTRFKSLNVGVQTTQNHGTEVRTVLSYAGSDQPIPNENNPSALFTRLFGSGSADATNAQVLRQRRHAALKFARERFAVLSPKVSAEDRRKLDYHLASLNDIDSRLDNGSSTGPACTQPVLTSPESLTDPANYEIVGKLQTDLVAAALACDLTRVVVFQWSAATNNRPYPFLQYNDGSGLKPITDDEHILGHQPDTDVHAWGRLNVIRRWYMSQLAALLDKLQRIPEGNGWLIDNTIVVWCSEIAMGNSHSRHDTPFLLCGGAGGAYATNRYLRFSGNVPHNNLWVSLMNAMGVPATTFGDPNHCTGALAGLL